MFRSCREAGLEEPRLEEVGLHFRVTFYRERRREPTRDQLEIQILASLQKQGELSTKQIANLIGLSPVLRELG